jgi:hypothetical protein
MSTVWSSAEDVEKARRTRVFGCGGSDLTAQEGCKVRTYFTIKKSIIWSDCRVSGATPVLRIPKPVGAAP